MSKSWHPDEAQLLAYADAELAAGEAAEVAEHVGVCGECSARVAEFRSAYAAVKPVLQAQYPPPPEAWPDLRTRLNDLDAGRVRSRRLLFPRVDYRWVAAAAGLVIAILAFRLTTGQTVSAAELLEKATIQEARSAAVRRVRVKTRKAQWVRGNSHADDSRVAALFSEANYNWDEPLSPRSFAKWRASLASKEDRVKILNGTDFGRGRFYLITTSTLAGTLAEASITLRAEDMRAVQNTFQFRNDEFVEVTEDTEAAIGIPRERIASAEPETSRVTAPLAMTPGHELRVVAALHSIGADLGEPVDVTRSEDKGRILVKALITDPERQQQIRTALSGLPFVELQFDQPEAVRATARQESAGVDEATQSNAIQESLSAKLGGRVPLENFTNHVMDLSEAALTRAHALRALGERFPPEAEAQLTAAERETLHAIRTDHSNRLLASVRTISEAVRPIAPTGSVGAVETRDWHAAAGMVLEAARQFDEVATRTLAAPGSTESPDEALRNLGHAASELRRQAEALQRTMARSGAR